MRNGFSQGYSSQNDFDRGDPSAMNQGSGAQWNKDATVNGSTDSNQGPALGSDMDRGAGAAPFNRGSAAAPNMNQGSSTSSDMGKGSSAASPGTGQKSSKFDPLGIFGNTA